MSSDAQAEAPGFTLPRAPVGVRIVEGSRADYAGRVHGAELEAAYARGRDDGVRIASEQAAGALNAAAEQLEAACARSQPELTKAAIELAVEIARAVVRCEIDAGRHGIERIVRETLATSGVGRGACVVHVNPLDAERLKPIPFRAGTRIEADPEVATGDVHVTTPHGVLVRDLDDVLASIRDRLHGELT